MFPPPLFVSHVRSVEPYFDFFSIKSDAKNEKHSTEKEKSIEFT